MKSSENMLDVTDRNRASGAAVGLIVGSLFFCILTVIVHCTTTIPPIDANRADSFTKALIEIRSNETEALNTPAWIDRPRGIVRMPIETAMQRLQDSWKDPASGRNDLISRSQKANAPLPKTAPAPSQFE